MHPAPVQALIVFAPICAGLWLAFWLLVLFTILSTGCSTDSYGPTATPASADQAAAATALTLTFFKAAPAEEQMVRDALPGVLACVGLTTRGAAVPVTVEDRVVNCAVPGELVPAAGCTFFDPMRVFLMRQYMGNPYFTERHELIHVVLALRGEDVGHSNPAFARCDHVW